MSKRGNGEGTIFYNERLKKWVSQYSISGKRKAKYGNTRKEALQKMQEDVAKTFNGTYVNASNVKLFEFLEHIEKSKLNANRIIESTYLRNISTISRIKSCFDEDIKIQDITSITLQNFFNSQKDTLQSNIDTMWRILNSGFKKAILEEFIAKNPMDKILKPISSQRNSKIKSFNISEEKKLIQYLHSSNTDINLSNIILLSLFTGMRIGEIGALTFDDIDFKNKKIIVSKTLTRDINDRVIIGNNTKTGRKKRDQIGKREIPFEICENNFLEILLQEQINNSKLIIQNKNNLLFCDSRGNPIQPNLINRKFKTICKNAQIRPTIVKRCINQKEVNTKSSDTNFHMCRHTFATRCIECGIDVIVLSKLLGHSKIETTLNVYIDVFDQYRNKNLENLNNYYKENKIHFKIS